MSANPHTQLRGATDGVPSGVSKHSGDTNAIALFKVQLRQRMRKATTAV